jgi:anaerobic magnesium-protoporphyrin IX monomethyl ester cyclase
MPRRKVILFHPRTLHEKNYRYYYIPYSVLSIASVIDRDHYEVQVIDNNVEKKADYSDVIAQSSNDLLCVGISSMIGHQIREGLGFASAVHGSNPSIPIIWGGALPTMLPHETILHENVDIIVKGQGEVTFRELLNALSHSLPLRDVAGISFKMHDRILDNPPRPFIDPSNFPPYRSIYDLIDVADYVRFDEHINSRTISYHSSQGCPFNCGFCCETALWQQRWGGFAAQRVLDDIEYLASTFRINGIKFYDSEFFINQRRALEFADGLIERGLDVKWSASAHPANLNRLTEDQFALLARTGCSRLLLGAESGVREELELVGKATNQAMIVRLAERCSRYGITASFTFVLGYPGSSESWIQRTLDFAKQLRKVDDRHEIKVHFYAPYPGTPLYPLALQHGFKPPQTLEEWSWYDYYYVTTPWVDKKWERIVREFNEEHYPYLHPFSLSGREG